jgi:ribosomal protein S18 acetylase RimI-like enzyme
MRMTIVEPFAPHSRDAPMDTPRIRFEPIDLDAHASVCVAFRRDSFLCSFGVDRFFEDAGPEGVNYLGRMRRRMAAFPGGYVHGWLGEQIVGQIEMRVLEEPRIGYVNLFYLVAAVRGRGFGADLQGCAMRFMDEQGVQVVRLSVSPTNARALAYYRKHGWTSLGPRPGHEHMLLMEHVVPDRAGRAGGGPCAG